MEKTFRKPAEDTYPQKIFAHQLITVDDLFQFKKELFQQLLAALKSRSNNYQRACLKLWLFVKEETGRALV